MRKLFLLLCLLAGWMPTAFAVVPVPDHVVIVVLENHGYGQIVGSSAAPYLNGLINDPYSAFFTQSFALSHPSQPNYIQLFSGSNQGVIDDNVPAGLPFMTMNMGAALLAAGKTFVGYSEDLPSVGYTGATSGAYARKHNPWVNWQGTGTNGLPTTTNQPLTAFPTNYSLLPTVSYVIPNQDNDMHNGSDPSRITIGDMWVQTHLDAYAQWAKTHNSLLIITFDEDDGASANRIFTLFLGSMVQHNQYATTVNHYNVLRTIEDMYGLSHSGAAATSTPIDFCWNMCNQVAPTVSPAGPLVLCSGNTQVLTASSGASYFWSTGATTQSITVSAAGTYTVTVTSAGGCTRSASPVVVSTGSANTKGLLFTETVGAVTTNPTTIASWETANNFDNDAFTYSGTAELRNSNPSLGYTGASGTGCFFITSTAGKNVIISGINTNGLSNLQLSFGINKNLNASDGSDLLVQVSTNGTNYTNLSMPLLPTGSGTSGTIWHYRTITSGIPASPTVYLQFKQNAATTQYRIDDISIRYAATPTITASGPTTFCSGDSVTLTASTGSNYLWSTGAITQSIKVTTAGTYSVTVDCATSAATSVTVNPCSMTLNVNAFIQGFYLGGGVQAAVADPSGHPGICDTVTVELHNATSPFSTAYSVTGVLNTEGTGSFQIPIAAQGNSYYVVLRHRNSIETWSKNPLLFSGSLVSFDFTVPDQTAPTNPAPVVSGISPNAATAGTAAFTLTVNGSGFVNGSVVKWNGTALTTSYVNNTQLTASVPATNISSAGTAAITVFTGTPGGGTSSGLTFTITAAANPAPVVSGIAPNSATAGTAAFTLTVNGSGFVNGSVVKWNGAALTTTYVNSTQLTAAVPATNIATAGTATITVFTATPGGGTSNSFTFTINAAVNPFPVITGISPTSATAGSSAFTLTVSGSNFINGSAVNWNGTALTTTVVSSTQLTASVPATNISAAGTATITVVTPAPGGGASNSVSFTINAAANPVPVITTLTPNSATAGASAFTMTVSGSGFVNGSVVKWNGTALTTTYVSSIQLTAAVPATSIAAVGTATVTVFSTTPGGGTSSGVTFTIASPVKKFLFDATKAEQAGNADWVVDADASVPRFPTPAQTGITAGTSETFWTGAISAWGVALAKKGHTIETLPSSGSITYGNASNTQDLSNYSVFVVDEPNVRFTAAEKTAILQFVNNGGGLFMVADHTVSDRNNDGWDSPDIWNDLMTNNTVQNDPFGFSIDLTNITEVSANISATASTNPILNGTEGAVTQLEFNNGATITTNTTSNPNVQGLIWQTGFTKNNTHVMCATSTYGSGRVFVITDSSPCDDGTGDTGDVLFNGWGVFSHAKLFMNASLWLAKLQ